MPIASWIPVLGSALRPSQLGRARCLRAGDAHIAARRGAVERRTRALAEVVHRIQTARAEVFAKDDGIVSARMTELEREWRTLARFEMDDGLMDLWARVAPASWIDRKRWRDSDAGTLVDAAVTLAADPNGVEAAEHAVGELARALGHSAPRRVRWRIVQSDSIIEHSATAETLLRASFAAAREALRATDISDVVLIRAHAIALSVHEAATSQLPAGPLTALLTADLAHAALVDFVIRAATSHVPSAKHLTNPVDELRALWTTGYAITALDETSATLVGPTART